MDWIRKDLEIKLLDWIRNHKSVHLCWQPWWVAMLGKTPNVEVGVHWELRRYSFSCAWLPVPETFANNIWSVISLNRLLANHVFILICCIFISNNTIIGLVILANFCDESIYCVLICSIVLCFQVLRCSTQVEIKWIIHILFNYDVNQACHSGFYIIGYQCQLVNVKCDSWGWCSFYQRFYKSSKRHHGFLGSMNCCGIWNIYFQEPVMWLVYIAML